MNSLGNKLNAAIFWTLAIFGSVLGGYFVSHEGRLLRADLEERVAGVLSSLSANCEYPVLVGNRDEIDRLGKNVLKQKDVVGCSIKAGDGRFLFQSGAASGGMVEEFSSPIRVRKSAAGAGEELMLGGGAEKEEEIGSVQLAVSFAGLRSKIRRVQLTLLLLVLLMIAAVSLGSSLLLRRILIRPVARLVRGTEQIAKGDLAFRVPVESRDEIGRLSGAFNGMTEKLAQTLVSKEELEKSSSLLRATLDSTADALLAMDNDGRIVTYNSNLLQICHVCGGALNSVTDNQLLVFDPGRLEEPEALRSLLEALRRNPEAESSNLIAFKDGKVIESYSKPQRLGEGIVGRVWSFRDVTERRKSEKEKEELQTRLFQSEKIAAVGQLAGGVAHEINNPLGVILGFAQSLMRKTGGGGDYSHPLQCIEREALRCRNLVQELLTFSRVGGTQKEASDLNAVLESALYLVETEARVKSVQIKKDFGEIPEKIRVNRNQIQQIVVNLCNNAMDAMPKGGGISVETRWLENEGDKRVRIRVRDTGMGIPEAVLSKIFEPFFTTKEVGKGTGLGLSLVYEIVKKHGGTISVDSRVGEGTCFIIEIPASL